MHDRDSLGYLNLASQVRALEQTVQSLVQYQRLLYVELLQIKRKVGIEDTADTDNAQMTPQQMMMQQQMMGQQANGNNLDISSIHRALNLSAPQNRTRRSRESAAEAN